MNKMIIFLLLLLSHIANGQQIDTQVIYASTQCQYQAQNTKEIDKEELKQIFDYNNQFVIPPIPYPTIDFDTSMLILVSTGYQSHLSQKILLKSDVLTVNFDGNILTIPATFSHKDTQITGQITNAPCLVFQLERVDYQSIKLGM